MAKRRANGEGSLYKRSDGTWTAQYTDYTGKKRYLYGKTQQIVKDKLKEAIKQNDAGVVIANRKIMFSGWVTEWMETYSKPFVRDSSYNAYERAARMHIIPHFKRIALKDVRADTLQKFFNEKMSKRLDGKSGGYSYSTLNSIKSVISSSLEKAVDLGYIAFNPAKKVKILPEQHKEKYVLTTEEQAALERLVLSSLDKDYNNFIFLLILYTGLRIGEVTGLQLGDIDLGKKELYVRRTVGRVRASEGGHHPVLMHDPKTAKGKRTIPLSPQLVKLLQEHIERRRIYIERIQPIIEHKSYYDPKWIANEFLFISHFGKLPDHTNIADRLDRFTKQLDIPHIGPHNLRHTFATRWMEAGLDVKSLSEILGHANAKMTLNIYTHSLPEQKRQSMDHLTTVLSANRQENA